jgi:hypothetical protein
MPSRISALILLLAASAVAQNAVAQNAVELAGGLKAEVVSMARIHGTLTVAVRIPNGGKDNASILLFGKPAAFDDADEEFGTVNEVAGVAYCLGPESKPPTFRLCVGLPRVTDSLFPLECYTSVGSGKAVTVQFRFSGGGDKGDRVSLTQQIAYRFIADDDRSHEASLADADKLKSIHIGTLEFQTAPGELKATQ